MFIRIHWTNMGADLYGNIYSTCMHAKGNLRSMFGELTLFVFKLVVQGTYTWFGFQQKQSILTFVMVKYRQNMYTFIIQVVLCQIEMNSSIKSNWWVGMFNSFSYLESWKFCSHYSLIALELVCMFSILFPDLFSKGFFYLKLCKSIWKQVSRLSKWCQITWKYAPTFEFVLIYVLDLLQVKQQKCWDVSQSS